MEIKHRVNLKGGIFSLVFFFFFLNHQTGLLLLSFQAESVGGALALRVPVTKRTT